MSVLRAAFMLCLSVWEIGGASNNSTYAFFRDLRGIRVAGARRVFGGAAAELTEFPAICALLDRYWSTRCSASVLSSHWALTAAHCISPLITYIKYNTRRPIYTEGNVAAVHYLYQHPEYRVLQEDDGHGMDVTLLHHDVGLVRTRDVMKLHAALPSDPLLNLRRYDPMNLLQQEVQVLGFGRTESTALGEELCGARLRLTACKRDAWYHVVCGIGGPYGGVCAGDSGGPLVFAGTQVAVTSMGPQACVTSVVPALGTISVFTILRPYIDVLNATITDTDVALRMRMISAAVPSYQVSGSQAVQTGHRGGNSVWRTLLSVALSSLLIQLRGPFSSFQTEDNLTETFTLTHYHDLEFDGRYCDLFIDFISSLDVFYF